MPKQSRIRLVAARRQSGKCCYCGQPMWTDNAAEFARAHSLGDRQVLLFRATAEHLFPKSDGGRTTVENIAAACHFCNRTRHRLKRVPPPDAYRRYVMTRLAKGRWNRLQT